MFEGREQMTFGIPKKRVEKVYPYEGKCLLIMHKAPESKGGTYKFELTKLALEELDLVKINSEDEKLVSFSFDSLDPVIANTTELKGKIESSSQYNVSMSGIFSNKPVYEHLVYTYQLDDTIDNVFLVALDSENNKIATIFLEEDKKETSIEEINNEFGSAKEDLDNLDPNTEFDTVEIL